jgi:hypothetical protein
LPFTTLLGNSISERLEPDVVGSLGASCTAMACLVGSAGSACLPKRSVSPFGSSEPLIPPSGICCAVGYWPSTCAPQPDCCAKGTLPLASPRMSLVLIDMPPTGVGEGPTMVPELGACALGALLPSDPPPQPARQASTNAGMKPRSEIRWHDMYASLGVRCHFCCGDELRCRA